MSVSAVMIIYNEEEMLPGCLALLDSFENVTEIVCVVDAATNDRTEGILDRYAARKNRKKFTMVKAPFTSFGGMRNIGNDLATGDWIFTVDPDDAFTPHTDALMSDLKLLPGINAAKLPTMMMYQDRRHYINQESVNNLDPHITIVRKGFARYTLTIHEDFVDINNRHLHVCTDPDILETFNIPQYHKVGRKHLQLLKSDAALAFKGLRWLQTGSIAESAKRGIPVQPHSWYEWKKWAFMSKTICSLPLDLYDITSDW